MAEDGPSSQGGARGRASQTLRPVTLKQLREAVAAPGNETFTVEGPSGSAEIGQVTFVAAVRLVGESRENGMDYVFEDGTGSFSGRVWPDKVTGVLPEPLAQDTWARVHGTLRAFGEKRSVNVHEISAITNFNEMTMHFLQVLALSWPHHGIGAARTAPGAALDTSGMTPAQRMVAQHCHANGSAEQGLHRDAIVRALAKNLPAAEVNAAIDSLIGSSILFNTIDMDHVRIIVD